MDFQLGSLFETILALACAQLFMAMVPPASANDFAGQASIIGGTLEIHGARIRLWTLMHLRAISFAGPTVANTTAAGRKPRTTLMPSLVAAL
jgi:hypothetical protein